MPPRRVVVRQWHRQGGVRLHRRRRSRDADWVPGRSGRHRRSPAASRGSPPL